MDFLAAVLPAALVALFAALWWKVLSRPWIFVLSGALSLYALMALLAVAVILIGPGFHGYFLEAPSASATPPSRMIETVALILLIVIGTAILGGLKKWLV